MPLLGDDLRLDYPGNIAKAVMTFAGLAFCTVLVVLVVWLVLARPARAETCLIAGDSIAVDLGRFGPCSVDARIGIGSAAIVGRVRPASIVVISAGSNDPHNPRLADNLRAARRKAGDSKVVWIVPALRPAAAAVRAVAAIRGDRTVAFTPGRDGVHPKCPRCLAHDIFGPASTGE